MSDDLGPLPAVHPRSVTMSRAEADLAGLLIEWRERHGLTISEALMLLAGEMRSTLSYCVRAERRGPCSSSATPSS